MWWLRFSTDPYGRVLACGNTQGRTYVWSPGSCGEDARAARAVELRHKGCNAVVRAALRVAAPHLARLLPCAGSVLVPPCAQHR